MRCDNCGWDNDSTASHCLKCRTKLDTAKPEPAATVKSASAFSATISDSDPASQREDNTPSVQNNRVAPETETLVACPNPECGYLNSALVKVCPKCKTPVSPAKVEINADNEPGASKTKRFTDSSPSDASSSFAGTIDPYRRQTNIPACTLEMVPKEGESVDADSLQRKFTAQADEAIALNRANLDDTNKSITGKTQAELVYENHKWYLTDKSELQTTFIRTALKTELRDGDIILMGDRRFIFTSKQED